MGDKRIQLLEAASENKVEELERLLEAGIDVNAQDQLVGFWSSGTPLHYAAHRKHLECVEILLKKGADPKSRNWWDETPLHWALTTEEIDGVRKTQPINCHVLAALLNANVDINARNRNGVAVLHSAACRCTEDSIPVVELLLERGAELSIKDNFGKQPLHCAATYSNYDMVEFLINRGADVAAEDVTKSQPLLYAARFNRLDVVHLLLDRGADILARDVNNQEPLDYEVVRALVNRGDCINYNLDSGLQTSLCRFVLASNRRETIKELLQTHHQKQKRNKNKHDRSSHYQVDDRVSYFTSTQQQQHITAIWDGTTSVDNVQEAKNQCVSTESTSVDNLQGRSVAEDHSLFTESTPPVDNAQGKSEAEDHFLDTESTTPVDYAQGKSGAEDHSLVTEFTTSVNNVQGKSGAEDHPLVIESTTPVDNEKGKSGDEGHSLVTESTSPIDNVQGKSGAEDHSLVTKFTTSVNNVQGKSGAKDYSLVTEFTISVNNVQGKSGAEDHSLVTEFTMSMNNVQRKSGAEDHFLVTDSKTSMDNVQAASMAEDHSLVTGSTSMDNVQAEFLAGDHSQVTDSANVEGLINGDSERFEIVIGQEREHHKSEHEIRDCLRKGMGPNVTVQKIVKKMSKTKKEKGSGKCHKCISYLKCPMCASYIKCNTCTSYLKGCICISPINWLKSRAKHLISSAKKLKTKVEWLLPFFSALHFCSSYYLDLGMDIMLAVQRTGEFSSTDPVVVALSWMFALLPSFIINFHLYLKLHNMFQNDDEYGACSGVFKGSVLKKWYTSDERKSFRGLLLSLVQGWPCFVKFTLTKLQNDWAKQCTPLYEVPYRNIEKKLQNKVRRIRQMEALLEATPQLLMQLWITLQYHQIPSTLVMFKIGKAVFGISYSLLQEEVLSKKAHFSFYAKMFLTMSLFLRCAARILCIVLFTWAYTYWGLPMYILHVLAVLLLQIYDIKKQDPSNGGWNKSVIVAFTQSFKRRRSPWEDWKTSELDSRSKLRVIEALSNFFNYIPRKNYNVNVYLYSRTIFLVLCFFEDLFMLVLVHALVPIPPYFGAFFLYCSGIYFGIIFVSHAFLLLYYKKFHPWWWNVELLRLFR